jgi:hypothetical protein
MLLEMDAYYVTLWKKTVALAIKLVSVYNAISLVIRLALTYTPSH